MFKLDQNKFKQDGYELFSNRDTGLVDESLLAEALSAIASDPTYLPEDEIRLQQSERESFCESLRKSPSIMALLHDSKVEDVLNDTFGAGKWRSDGQGQIAIRHALRGGGPPHIDGFYPQNQPVNSFTILAGVSLTDNAPIDAGNFGIVPGSHWRYAEHFKEQGAAALQPVVNDALTAVHTRKGDVVFAHYMLAHGTLPNKSCDPRVIVYFRISLNDAASLKGKEEHLRDLWRGWWPT